MNKTEKDLFLEIDTNFTFPFPNTGDLNTYLMELKHKQLGKSDRRRVLHSNYFQRIIADNLYVLINGEKVDFNDTAANFLRLYLTNRNKFQEPGKHFECSWFAAGINGLIPDNFSGDESFSAAIPSGWQENTSLDSILKQFKAANKNWNPNIIGFFDTNRYAHYGTLIVGRETSLVLSKFGLTKDIAISSIEQIKDKYPYQSYTLWSSPIFPNHP
jgi:hypothetical protein